MTDVGAGFRRVMLRAYLLAILGIVVILGTSGGPGSVSFGQDLPPGIPPIPALGVTLGWDANPESDIAGYRVHFGVRSGAYIRRFDVGYR